MTVYTWLVVLLLLAAFIFKGNRSHSIKFLIIAFLLLFAVMGLRDVNAFGSDASGTNGSYPVIYKAIGKTAWGQIVSKGGSNYNFGFNYLIKLIYELTNGNYQLLITTISLFVVFSYVRFIAKYSPAPIQSILCFLGLLYYTFLFDALKQALAMAILLFAFDAIIEKEPIKFIILTLIAATIHFPALIFMPAYWMGRMKIGRGYIAILALLLLFTYIFRDQLLRIMTDAYGGSDTEVTMSGIRFLRNKVIIMIVVVAFAVYIRPPAPQDSVYNALLIFTGVAIIFQTFCGYNNIFERLADYYFHTAIVFIPLIFEKGGRSKARLRAVGNVQILNYLSVIVCVFAAWRFLSFVNNSTAYMPCRFLWQQ